MIFWYSGIVVTALGIIYHPVALWNPTISISIEIKCITSMILLHKVVDFRYLTPPAVWQAPRTPPAHAMSHSKVSNKSNVTPGRLAPHLQSQLRRLQILI